jgi:hypothetical protein
MSSGTKRGVFPPGLPTSTSAGSARGLAGKAYMAAIKPFRYLVVYPQILRAIKRRWREQQDHGSST